MEPVMLNNEIRISGLDLFRVMTEEEMIHVRHDKKGICIIAPDLHIILSLAWKKEGGLFSRLLGGNDPVANIEACYRKSFKPYGYVLDGYLERTIAGENARGLRYTYTAQGIGMSGETYVLKKNGTIYYLHSYYRTSFREECVRTWNDILDTARYTSTTINR